LFGRIVEVTKKLLLQTNVTRAYDVGTVLPSTVTKLRVASSTILLLRSVPTASRLGSIPTPPVATSVGCDMATARASVGDRWFRKGVVVTKGGCRRAGVVPAVPRKGEVSMMEMWWGTIVLTQLWEERVWRQPAAGFSNEGGYKRSFHHLCPEKLSMMVSDECCASSRGGRTKRALEGRRSIYRSIGHIKQILLTRILSKNLSLSKRQRM
jgi:hypothetical protein